MRRADEIRGNGQLCNMLSWEPMTYAPCGKILSAQSREYARARAVMTGLEMTSREMLIDATCCRGNWHVGAIGRAVIAVRKLGNSQRHHRKAIRHHRGADNLRGTDVKRAANEVGFEAFPT